MVFEKTLTAMVKGIRANRGKEADYISTCMQEIQKEVMSKNMNTKSNAVLKMTYLGMLGYDMTWSTFAVVEVMSHQRFALKRAGYLASAVCFNDSTDVGLLTINLFKKDFGSKSMFETGMALSTLASICSPEISRDIVTDLTGILSSARPYLRKKCVLCMFKIFVKYPTALRTCFPKLKERLGDEDQGVLTATVNTFLELARKNAKNYLSLVPQMYHILVNTSNNWLTIKLLKLFQLLCPLEPRLPSKMVEPLSNLLNTTKAQSVEYEAIRTVIRVVPEGSESLKTLCATAVERLQSFLNSSDRNLRYLALELYAEILVKPSWKANLDSAELHEKVLESVEESDSSARKIALQLLDGIVSPAIFMDTVKKLMEYAKNASNPDEYLGTILVMGSRDRYALVEDFAGYLLVLAEIAKNKSSCHAAEVASQFIDICVRVPQVRSFAATLALSLLDRAPPVAGKDPQNETESSTEAPAGGKEQKDLETDSSKEGSLDLAEAVIGACAWALGEYHDAFESPTEVCFVKAVRALVVPRHIHALVSATIQTQCLWAATKLYLGSAKHAASVVGELHELLSSHLPAFVASTLVDVSERASLALHLTSFFGTTAEKVGIGAALQDESLLPVHAEAQKNVPIPELLNLDEPFFAPEVNAPDQSEAFSYKADVTDPYSLAASYKDDLGFLAAEEQQRRTAAPAVEKNPQASMFYLSGAKDAASSGGGEDPSKTFSAGSEVKADSEPKDPLELMKERLAASRAGGGVKYQVNREDVQLAPSPAVAAPSSLPHAVSSTASSLPVPGDKELAELGGRLWSMCYKDDHIVVYVCVKSKNNKKQSLLINLRCEKIGQASAATLTDVALKLPSDHTAQEADASGMLIIHAGELVDRSAKVKLSLGLAPFAMPSTGFLACEVQYNLAAGGEASKAVNNMELKLPPTSFLIPAPMSEDDLATYISENASVHLNQQTAQALSFSLPGASVEALAEQVPGLMGRCAGLCNFHGIQQGAGAPSSSPGTPQKYLLVARPPPAAAAAGGSSMPEGSLVVCLCAGLPKADGCLDVRVTVKSCRKDVSDDVCSHLSSIFQELAEGRLKA